MREFADKLDTIHCADAKYFNAELEGLMHSDRMWQAVDRAITQFAQTGEAVNDVEARRIVLRKHQQLGHQAMQLVRQLIRSGVLACAKSNVRSRRPPRHRRDRGTTTRVHARDGRRIIMPKGRVDLDVAE